MKQQSHRPTSQAVARRNSGRARHPATGPGALGRGLICALLSLPVVPLGGAHGQALDTRDARHIAPSLNRALEFQESGVDSAWYNPLTGHGGVIVIERTLTEAGAAPCRAYRWTVEHGVDQPTVVRGEACRRARLDWAREDAVPVFAAAPDRAPAPTQTTRRTPPPSPAPVRSAPPAPAEPPALASRQETPAATVPLRQTPPTPSTRTVAPEEAEALAAEVLETIETPLPDFERAPERDVTAVEPSLSPETQSDLPGLDPLAPQGEAESALPPVPAPAAGEPPAASTPARSPTSAQRAETAPPASAPDRRADTPAANTVRPQSPAPTSDAAAPRYDLPRRSTF